LKLSDAYQINLIFLGDHERTFPRCNVGAWRPAVAKPWKCKFRRNIDIGVLRVSFRGEAQGYIVFERVRVQVPVGGLYVPVG